MNNQIILPRPTAGRVLLQADAQHITVTCAWSVLLDRATVLEYLRTVDSNPTAGFFSTGEGQVALAHGAARISFSEQEFTEIRRFVEQVYPSN